MESGQRNSTLKELLIAKYFTKFGLKMSELEPMFTKWVEEGGPLISQFQLFIVISEPP